MIDHYLILWDAISIMKYKIKNSCLSLLVLSALVLINSCASNPAPGKTENDPTTIKYKAKAAAKKYNLELLDAILDADKIVIKEHSDKVDFFGMTPEPSPTPQYTYATKELNMGEKMLLRDDIMALEGVAKTKVFNGLFVPHHTMEFYEQGVLKSSMKICFDCPAVRWDAASRVESEDVLKALTVAVKRAGMHPNQTWDAVAREWHSKASGTTNLPPKVKLDGFPVAKWAEGQIGKKVLNPYNGNLVDVDGIAADTKVRDPLDGDPTHVFKVPAK